jgi:hypothetical protein
VASAIAEHGSVILVGGDGLRETGMLPPKVFERLRLRSIVDSVWSIVDDGNGDGK